MYRHPQTVINNDLIASQSNFERTGLQKPSSVHGANAKGILSKVSGAIQSQNMSSSNKIGNADNFDNFQRFDQNTSFRDIQFDNGYQFTPNMT